MQLDYTKQVIVIRKDLNMRKGKLAAQAAHAATAAVLHNLARVLLYKLMYKLGVKSSNALFHWVNDSFTKICVSVNSEAELDTIYNFAKQRGIPAYMIVDKGVTEFNNVPTKTCLSIGPAYNAAFLGVTSHLPLM